MLTASIERLRWQWDNLPDADRQRIFSTVIAHDGFLNELHQRKPYSALVMAACLEELARHARRLPPA